MFDRVKAFALTFFGRFPFHRRRTGRKLAPSKPCERSVAGPRPFSEASAYNSLRIQKLREIGPIPAYATLTGLTAGVHGDAMADRTAMSRLKPRFGAHMPIAGGLENAFAVGAATGCDCLQIFLKNQRQWKAKPLTDEQVSRYRQAQNETRLSPVVAHAGYLINLASPEKAVRQRSVKALLDELDRCEALGVSCLVLHPGAHRGDSLNAGINRIARSLDAVHQTATRYRTMILLETTAGQGTAIGYRFEQLAAILDRVRESGRLGVCLDTCHLFAAGYDFRSAEGYAAMVEQLDRTVGANRVKCIHANDSKMPCGSRVDRHEHIGKGKIGKAGLAHFVNDRRWAAVPMILETPKGRDGRGTDLDKVNLKRLRAMIRA